MEQKPSANSNQTPESNDGGDEQSPGSNDLQRRPSPPPPTNPPQQIEVKDEEPRPGDDFQDSEVKAEDGVCEDDEEAGDEDEMSYSEEVSVLPVENDDLATPDQRAREQPEFRRSAPSRSTIGSVDLNPRAKRKAVANVPAVLEARRFPSQPVVHRAADKESRKSAWPPPMTPARLYTSSPSSSAYISQQKLSLPLVQTPSSAPKAPAESVTGKATHGDDGSQPLTKSIPHDEDHTLHPAKQKIVDGVMASFIDWLDTRLGVRVRTESSQSPQNTSRRFQRRGPSLSARIQPLEKRRRADDGDEDGNDDGTKQPRSKQTRLGGNEPNRSKLACPFFKHNPRKYKNQRPCCGPGWDHVHRIKEHLYRKHSLPKFMCQRCCEPFEVEEQLQVHAKATTPCQARELLPSDSITQVQETKLRSRKKNGAKELTEAEKWKQMYQILFPDVRENEIPSPYYINDDDKLTNLDGYEDYLRRELPPLVRRGLEEEIERELQFVSDGLKERVVEIARNLQLALFRSYQQMEVEQEETPSLGGSQSSESMTVSPETLNTGSTPDAPDPLNLLDDPSFALPNGDDFDFSFLSQSYEMPSAGFSA